MTAQLFRSPDVAPYRLKGVSVFLAGSIEMGKAELWQPRVAETLLDMGVNVFDPRRTDWDASWEHDPTPGTPFETQVSWELNHLDRADVILFRITAGTDSIVSMLELGMSLQSGKPVIMWVDPGYKRFGNIVVTANKLGRDVFMNEEDAMDGLRRVLRKFHVVRNALNVEE